MKVEKVDHTSISCYDTCCIVAYYKTSDTLSQANFIQERNALLSKNTCTVGMWKPKQQKLNH